MQRVRERGVHVEVERVAVLVRFARRLGLDAGREVLGVVGPEARLADAPQEVFQGSIAEEVDALLGEIELHLLGGLLGHPARTEQRLLPGRYLGRLGHVQVALVHELLGDLVEQGLEVDRIGQLGEVAAVRRVFHRAPYPKYRAAASFPAMDEAARTFRLGALSHRNFRLFFFGQGISLIGTWMQSIALGWLVLEITNSPFAVGLTQALRSLGVLLFTLYGG